MIFISGDADTIQTSEFRRIAPKPEYNMVCAAVPNLWTDAPARVTFERDGVAADPLDSWTQAGNTLSLCARTDGKRWSVCYVFADGRMIGRFLNERPIRRGRGPKVTE